MWPNPFDQYNNMIQGKPIQGAVYPLNNIQADQSWEELEPLITPEKVKSLHLFGVQLVSAMRDAVTQKNDVFPMTQMAEMIDYAVATAELETGLTILPRKFDKGIPFDPQEYRSYGYIQLPMRPIASIQEISIKIANNQTLWNVPLDWVGTTNLVWGQLNILTVGVLGVVTDTGNKQVIQDQAANAMLLNALFGQGGSWIPEFWRIKLTAGFPDGRVPKVINELIGTITAMEVLGLLATTYARSNSQSLSVGGLSESTGGLGPNLFDARLKQLEAKKAKLIKRIRNEYNLLFFSSNV
jgi:hypothetical protein